MPQPPKELTPTDGPRHLFGSEVRRYRALEGLSVSALASKITYSPSFVSAVERGECGCERDFAAAVDRVVDTREALVHLWDGLFSKRPGGMPEWFVKWPRIEDASEGLCVYNPCVVHGLFQNEDYASTLLFGDRTAIDIRMGRQAALTKPDAPRLVYLLPEWVLTHDVGGPEVMRRQLERLCEAVSPRVSVQVIPNGQPHPGNEGEFMLATLRMLDDRRQTEIGYVETAARGMILNEPEDIARLKDVFSQLRAHALPVGMSTDLITRVKEEHWKT